MVIEIQSTEKLDEKKVKEGDSQNDPEAKPVEEKKAENTGI